MSEPLAVGGLFELTVGVRSLEEAAAYWSRFGYTPGFVHTFLADEALHAYGVRSGLRSMRLLHGTSDHGLIRLMQWDAPVNDGIGLAPLRALGSRWGAALNTNLLAVQSHAESADEQGIAIRWLSSSRQDPAGPVAVPFLTELVHVREMIVLRPETRQVLFQRLGYNNPSYGSVVEAAFPTSQITHVGLVTAGDPQRQVFFYERALGLLRTRDGSTSGASDMASRRIFDLAPDESYRCWDFDDPRSSSEPSKWLSGRLKFIHFDNAPLDDLRTLSRLGCLGMSAYTWRVRDLDTARTSCLTHGAAELSAIGSNELGERQWAFTAPDGYDWLLIETR